MLCVSSLLIYYYRYALQLEVVDKRQVGLKSSNMEKAGFVRSVCNLFNKDIPIKEIVTDQNLQIIALISKRFNCFIYSIMS